MTTRIVCDNETHMHDVPAICRVTCYFAAGNTVSGIKSWDSCEEDLTLFMRYSWEYASTPEAAEDAKAAFAGNRGTHSEVVPHFHEVRITPYITVAQQPATV